MEITVKLGLQEFVVHINSIEGPNNVFDCCKASQKIVFILGRVLKMVKKCRFECQKQTDAPTNTSYVRSLPHR